VSSLPCTSPCNHKCRCNPLSALYSNYKKCKTYYPAHHKFYTTSHKERTRVVSCSKQNIQSCMHIYLNLTMQLLKFSCGIHFPHLPHKSGTMYDMWFHSDWDSAHLQDLNRPDNLYIHCQQDRCTSGKASSKVCSLQQSRSIHLSICNVRLFVKSRICGILCIGMAVALNKLRKFCNS
jgi:hypothetical protein